ncbi:MAG: nucleotide sugar dehydrogenase [Thermoleophilia bacterium]|nr:nucleotide sugar dehydrogenase [Thermoleophilia bacterium]
MRIAIFGLGYVGTVSAACLAQLGHEVSGVDVNSDKAADVAAGRSPIAEDGVAELLGAAVAAGRLRATTSAAQAAAWADASLVCVGTPSRANGGLDTSYVERVVEEIGAALPPGARHTVIIRSTLLPGTTLGVLRPILERSAGRPVGGDLGLAYNPEFLREGSAVRDFTDPPYTVVGGVDAASEEVAAALYDGLGAPVHRVAIAEAEAVKYAANAFHALKVTFANEIGHLCKAIGVDGHTVMDILIRDTKLNVSPAYLRPGFAFGGSCLPKDLRALLHAARRADVDLPMLEGVLPSNRRQVKAAVDLVLAQGTRSVAMLGLSFKAGTDDLRESPVVELAETLIGKGCRLRIYDDNVNWARLVGANRRYIEATIPHLAELMVTSVEAAIDGAEVIVVGNASPEFDGVLASADGRTVIDLVRLPGSVPGDGNGHYHGICW